MTTRVVSLVPAATEIAFALGLGDRLVAVTHDCDLPPGVVLPLVTGSTIPIGSSSREIDALVREAGERGDSTFHLDAAALHAARPDLTLGQTVCRVCAVTFEQLPSGSAGQVVPLDGTDLEGVLRDIRRVADALGEPARGESLVSSLRDRIGRVAALVADAPRPRTVALEWLDPLFCGGHWVPEQIALAGGHDPIGIPGERSREIGWDEVVGAAADVLVVMPCGYDTAQALADAHTSLSHRDGIAALPAMRSGRAFAVNGRALFSRPGPGLVDGIEVLAALLHPTAFPPPDGVAAITLG